MLPVIPFVSLPRKEWGPTKEKKARLKINYSSNNLDELNDEEFLNDLNSSIGDSIETDETSVYDLMDHINDLLPGEFVNGRPVRAANDQHLEDLRPKSVQGERFRTIKGIYRFFKRVRAAERERRKYYIIKEYEQQVKDYDENRRRHIIEEAMKHAEELRIIDYQREKRIRANSKKKQDKVRLTDEFLKNIDKRELEAKKIDFYVKNFPIWSDQDFIRNKAYEEERQRQQQQKEDERQRKLEEESIKQEEADRKQADKEDREFNDKIDRIMVKYGTFARPPATEISDKVDNLFARHQNTLRKQAKRMSQQTMLESQTNDFLASLDTIDDDVAGTIGKSSKKPIVDDDPKKLIIALRHDLDLPEVYQNLRKNRFKRDGNQRRTPYVNPFNIDSFQDTGEVLTLQGREIEEVGAFALAVELSRGACPMLQNLVLSSCRIGNEGLARILQGMKMSNIGSVRKMDLQGNFLSAKALNYLGEIGANGAFSNLRVLNLSKNELGDTGVEALLRLFFSDLLSEIREIYLCFNSITDIGFRMITQVFSSCQQRCCPHLKRIVLSNNLITGAARKEFWPLPSYLHL